MIFSDEEIDLLRQWFNALEDVTPEFLEEADYDLARRIATRLRTRLPSPRLTPEQRSAMFPG
ncbi:hypothetical protein PAPPERLAPAPP_02220 [Brevundimonas phage vB_BpoS-Papperlapapp]|uniref:Uncharacterized protein n=2 Tax=Marchewkavirus TaxID=3425052 RepID=A0A9E7MQJ7_9CAUD|nr:hypothetical protein KABACHOK_00600 [Brevundimonas phage vB_BpoS-Kabachok]USN14593.1 hypothetical protein DOMOVOI_01190 [Brevundimonas phage vB_BpoS-Domovoi]USN15963.1 hypothetical protein PAPPERLAPAPP_02220 [Brevundimonas phage vB_BpoS-Papperlapapp]